MLNEERLARLNSLLDIKPGWMMADKTCKPYGESISSKAVDATNQFYEIMQAMVEKPRFYPTPSGGVSIEWDYNGFLCGLDVDTSGVIDSTIICVRSKSQDTTDYKAVKYEIRDTSNV